MLFLVAIFVSWHASAQPSQEELLMNVFKGFVQGNAPAQSPQEELIKEIVAGSHCEQTRNNGLFCEYKVGQKLWISIKDVGGRDEIISFRHSDWDDDYFAAMYFGCIVIVPGAANQKRYGNQDAAFIAPKNGRVYRSRNECQGANK